MFNLQGSELLIILLLALVVLGPEKLPEAMRKLGEFVAQVKKMSAGFQQEFKSAVDDPMREVRDTASLLRDSVDFRKFQDGERSEKPKSADMAAIVDPPLETPPVDTPPDTLIDPPLEAPVDMPTLETPGEVSGEQPDDDVFEPRFDAPVDMFDDDRPPA